MTAKISPTISKGNRTPVDDFPPKTIAIRVTIIVEMPLIPDFDKPKEKAAKPAINHSCSCKSMISKNENKSEN